MRTDFEYINFEPDAPAEPRKTGSWSCVNTKSYATIGVVRWYGSWRQYCYFPDEGSIYSAGCLRDINTFLESVNTQHRAKATKPTVVE